MKKAYVLAVAVLIFVAAVIGAALWIRGGSEPTPSPSPSVSISPSPTQTPTPASSFRSIRPDVTAPASCEIGGQIVYRSKNIYESRDARIAWRNVDSSGRLITWTVTPFDRLAVGPNIFANLPIPSGTEKITVSLPTDPIARSYALTAAVTYGQIDQNDNVVVKTARCRGSISVTLSY